MEGCPDTGCRNPRWGRESLCVGGVGNGVRKLVIYRGIDEINKWNGMSNGSQISHFSLLCGRRELKYGKGENWNEPCGVGLELKISVKIMIFNIQR